MKKINSKGGSTFLINPENGRWGISREASLDKLETILKKPLPEKGYLGTELLVINSSNRCNLGCSYCSEAKHRKRTPSMTLDTGRSIIDSALTLESPPQIVFHGSEPTMNFDWIREVILYGHRKMQEENKTLTFSIQSNLARIPEGFLEFISKYKIGVSASLDGEAEVHDKTRPYLDGSPSFKDVMSNIKKIISYQGNLNVATVVTKFNVNKLEEISRFLESEGITSWQTIPAEGGYADSPDPFELGNSYVRLFGNVFDRIESGTQKLEVRTLFQYVSSMLIHNGIDACRTCSPSRLHPLLAVDHNGDVYPCDYFWGDDNAKIGNIKTDSIKDLSTSRKNIRMRNINDTGCSDCTWKMNCGGGCLFGSYNSENGRSPYCATHRKVYNYLAKKMPELIEKDLIKPVLSWLVK